MGKQGRRGRIGAVSKQSENRRGYPAKAPGSSQKRAAGLVDSSASPVAFAAIWVGVLALGVFFPGALNRWFLPKELVFLIAVLLATLVPAAGRVSRLIWGLIAAGAAVLLVAALTSGQPLAALFGRWPRYEGLISLPVMAVAVWFGARMLGPGAGKPRRDAWVRASSTLSIAIGVFALLEAWEFSPIASDLERSGSLLGNASDQGIVSAALAAVLVPRLLISPLRVHGSDFWWVATGTLSGILSVVLSASRGGLLGLAAGLAVSLAATVLVHWKAKGAPHGRAVTRRAAALGGGLLGTTLLVMLLVPMARDRVLGVSNLAAASAGDRWLMWGETLELLGRSPVLGVGPSGFVDAVAVQHGADWFAAVGPGTVLDSPHSWPLQAAMAGGWLLLLLAVVLVVCIATIGVQVMVSGEPQLFRKRNGGLEPVAPLAPATFAHRELIAGASGGLIAIAVGLATHFTSPATGILAGILIGAVCAVRTSGAPSKPRKFMFTAVSAAWVLVFSLTTAAEFPLNAGVRAGSAEEAEAAFSAAHALRPWDGDLASIAAQTFAQRADAGATGAGERGIWWAEAALGRVPRSLTVLTALGVSQRSVGDLQSSEDSLRAVYKAQPNDPRAMAQLGITLAMRGELDEAGSLLGRAESLAPGDNSVAAAAVWVERLRAAE